MSDLTVTGTPITDALRALAVEGDGLTADSSYGLWAAATNRCRNGGCETNTTDWTAEVGATITRVTSEHKFGSACGRTVTANAAPQEGLVVSTRTGEAAPSSSVWRMSIWLKGAAGGEQLEILARVANTDATTTNGTPTNITLTTSWQRFTASVTVTKTGDKLSVVVRNRSGVTASRTFYADGAQIQASVWTPYIQTDGAVASRAAAYAQAPSRVLDETQGWVALRMRIGDNTNLGFFSWADDIDNCVRLYFTPGSTFFAERTAAGNDDTADGTSTIAAGDLVTVIAAWTATTVALSLNGAAFDVEASTHIPTLAAAAFDIGRAISGPFDYANADIFWFACGTGTVTDGDAAALNAQGSTDSTPEDLHRTIGAHIACTMFWTADTPAYMDGAFTIIDPAPTGASRGLLPRLRMDIDFDTDPTATPRTWTDVTTDVRQLSYSRSGRSNELQRTEAGQISALLDNTSGAYDPTLHPDTVRRRRWVRVRARWAGVDYDRWTGVVNDWAQSWPGYGSDATAAVTGTDTFKVLNLFDLNGLSFPSQLTSARASAICEAASMPYSVQTGETTLVASGTLIAGALALPHLQEVEETENGLLFADAAGQIVFQDRHFRLTNPTSATPVGTIGDSTGEIPYADAELDLADSDLANVVTVTPSGGTAEMATNEDSRAAHWDVAMSRSILAGSQAEALACAQYLAGRYGDPAPRIPAVEVLGMKSTGDWPTILGAENSDRFTWVRRATAGTITEDVFVERVSETVAPGGSFRTTFQLSPAIDQAGWVAEDPINGLAGVTTVAVY